MDPRFLLLVSSALLAVSSAVSILPAERSQDPGAVDKNGVGAGLYDGIDLSTLTEEELVRLADAEDEILQGYIGKFLFI